MLYPQQNAARLTMSLDGVWDFALDHGDPAAPSLDPAQPLPGAETAAVPASFNDQKPDRAWRDHYGWVFYQRRITLPRACAGQRAVLRFGAVTHQAKVWLDGVLIAEHRGGFLPFEADLTGRLAPGASGLLTVAADNRVSHGTLPVGNEPGQIAFFGSDNAGIPSVEHAKANARPQNRPNFDFFNYAGIQRPVTLYTTPAAYIADITLVPHCDGRVDYRVETVGEGEVQGQAIGNLMKFVPITIFLILGILLLLFNSWRKVLLILLCFPFVFCGITPSLLLSGQPMTFMAIIGMMGLIGMMVKNAIVLVDEINRLQTEERMHPYRAVIEATVSRVRPVLMASLTTIVGMIPLLGDPMYGSMAITIMGGLTVGTIITLMLLPLFYTALFHIRKPNNETDKR